jgi:SAM-dependent methyltransferase
LGDAMNDDQFSTGSFTHILCLYFTIYYMKDKDRFFANCFNWLMPGGYLVVHLVNREMFDPIIPPANPLMLLTPQRYAKKRITSSAVTFDDFKYDSDFVLNPDNNEAKFVEKFKNKNTGKVFRKQEHQMYMEPEEDILRMAQDKGFIVQGKIDLIKSGYEYNSLYILTKPN